MTLPRVAVIGAGMSGAACARALRDRGITVEVYERGRAPGGRMASPQLHGRRVDLGAGYFTAKEPDFVGIVDDWIDAGLARPWTDTFDVLTPDGADRTSGPMRYATPSGLRSLVRDMLPEGTCCAADITALDDLDHDAVVLAMPDPQAQRLAPELVEWVDYDPVIAVAAGFAERQWTLTGAAFVNDDADVSFLADDGSRRGDGAPVLVAHTTPDRAREHLAHPESAAGPVIAALHGLLGTGEPAWTHVHRWTFAKPTGTHGDEPYGLTEAGGRPLGLCGDAWCPSGSPRVESAWLSGHRLGGALADTVLG